jgi:hypothetical protein
MEKLENIHIHGTTKRFTQIKVYNFEISNRAFM